MFYESLLLDQAKKNGEQVILLFFFFFLVLPVFVLTPLSFVCLLTVAMGYSGLRNEGPSVENLEPQIFPINPGVGQNISTGMLRVLGWEFRPF